MRFKDKNGREFALVGKKQRRQTLGRFFDADYQVDYIERFVAGRDTLGYMWNVVDQERDNGEPLDVTIQKLDYKLLCMVEELDEEVNEFGVISP